MNSTRDTLTIVALIIISIIAGLGIKFRDMPYAFGDNYSSYDYPSYLNQNDTSNTVPTYDSVNYNSYNDYNNADLGLTAKSILDLRTSYNNVKDDYYRKSKKSQIDTAFAFLTSRVSQDERIFSDYIINNESATNTEEWELIANAYAINTLFNDLKQDQSSEAYNHYDVRSYIESRSEYSLMNGTIAGYNIDYNKRKDGTYIVQISDIMNSGAYNISSYFYTLQIDKSNNEIKLNKIDVIDYNAYDKKDNQLYVGSSVDVNNYNYDKKTDMIVSYGMKPFSLYPCNDIWYYEILRDRMILKKVMTKVACVGKVIDSPSDMDKYFDNNTDLGALKLESTIPSQLYEKAKTIDINTLGKLSI